MFANLFTTLLVSSFVASFSTCLFDVTYSWTKKLQHQLNCSRRPTKTSLLHVQDNGVTKWLVLSLKQFQFCWHFLHGYRSPDNNVDSRTRSLAFHHRVHCPAPTKLTRQLFYRVTTNGNAWIDSYQNAKIWYFKCHQRCPYTINCTKIVGGRGSATDPAGELTTLSQTP